MKQKTNMLVTKEVGEKALKLKQKINMRMEDILILDYLSLNQSNFKEINKLEGEKIIFAVSRSKILENILKPKSEIFSSLEKDTRKHIKKYVWI